MTQLPATRGRGRVTLRSDRRSLKRRWSLKLACETRMPSTRVMDIEDLQARRYSLRKTKRAELIARKDIRVVKQNQIGTLGRHVASTRGAMLCARSIVVFSSIINTECTLRLENGSCFRDYHHRAETVEFAPALGRSSKPGILTSGPIFSAT